jgi:hypothetical protein
MTYPLDPTHQLAWLFNESPVADPEYDNKPNVVVNDRWGYDARAQHFNYHLCEDTRGSKLGYGCSPGFNPLHLNASQSGDHWAWTFGLGLGFGYNRLENATDYKSTGFILKTLVQAISLGGNLEMSIGPTSDGRIDNVVQQRLLEMGQWLNVNGECVYGSTRWAGSADGRDEVVGGTLTSTNNQTVFYTEQRPQSSIGGSSSAPSPGFVCAMVEGWPATGLLNLTKPRPNSQTVITLVGRPDIGPLKWTSPLDSAPWPSGGGTSGEKKSAGLEEGALDTAVTMSIQLPDLPPDSLPWGHFYSFKIMQLAEPLTATGQSSAAV